MNTVKLASLEKNIALPSLDHLKDMYKPQRKQQKYQLTDESPVLIHSKEAAPVKARYQEE